LKLCLCRELADAGIAFARQVTFPVVYESADVGHGFKADIVAAGPLILKSRLHHPANPFRAAPNVAAHEQDPRRSAA